MPVRSNWWLIAVLLIGVLVMLMIWGSRLHFYLGKPRQMESLEVLENRLRVAHKEADQARHLLAPAREAAQKLGVGSNVVATVQDFMDNRAIMRTFKAELGILAFKKKGLTTNPDPTNAHESSE